MIEHIWIFFLMPVFWWYFLVMQVKAQPEVEYTWLPKRHLTFGIFVRTSAVLALSLAVSKGYDLGNNLFVLSFYIAILIAPMAPPSPSINAGTENSFGFFVQWVASNIDVSVKTIIYLFLVGGISWLISIVLNYFEISRFELWYESITESITMVEAVSDHFVVPKSFMIAAASMLFWKSIVAAGAINLPIFRQYSWAAIFVSVTCSVVVLVYTYNISLLIPSTPAGWGSPTTGVISAWLLSLVFAYEQARWDEINENT